MHREILCRICLGRVFLISSLLVVLGCSSPESSLSPESPLDTAVELEVVEVGDSVEKTGAETSASRRIVDTASEVLSAENSPENASEIYVFYLHGAIVEGSDRRPTHPERGTYEYDEILQAIADTGVVVISEVRPAHTDVEAYADGVVGQINALISRGVDPARISVVGFSKGGAIALHISDRLGNDDVGFVIMAACGKWLDKVSFGLRGRLLSIYEKSDSFGSCRAAVERSSTEPFFHEVETQMGGGHGAFFKPQDEWLSQALLWCDAPELRKNMVAPEQILIVEPSPGEG